MEVTNMAHVAKYNKSSTGHMIEHYERTGKCRNRQEPNIDWDKTNLNYNLAPDRGNSIDFIRQRVGEVRCLKRKDVKVLCDWVVTIPKEQLAFHPDDTEKFFQSVYNFLEQKYGLENVVSSYVHMDESMPHMHFSFIPICKDKEKGDFHVSAKEVITRESLQHFHKELEDHVKKDLGYPVHMLNGITKQQQRMFQHVRDVSDEIIDYLQASSSEKLDDLDSRKVKRGFFNKAETIELSMDEYKKIKMLAQQLENAHILSSEIQEIGNNMEEEYKLMNQSWEFSKEKHKLQEQLEQASDTIKRVEKTIKTLDPDIQTQFWDIYSDLEKKEREKEVNKMK
jgi:hypothetical protein